MHDTALMRERQRARDFSKNAYRIADGKLALPREPCAQRLAAHVWHGEVWTVLRLAGREERYNVRMCELCGERDLASKSLDRHIRGDVVRKDLDHNSSPERAFLGEKDP